MRLEIMNFRIDYALILDLDIFVRKRKLARLRHFSI